MEDGEVLPTEAIFACGFRAGRQGRFTTREIAQLYGYTYHGADAMLNKAARLTPITKDGRGVWIVTDRWEETIDVIQRLLPHLKSYASQHDDLRDLTRALETLLSHRLVP